MGGIIMIKRPLKEQTAFHGYHTKEHQPTPEEFPTMNRGTTSGRRESLMPASKMNEGRVGAGLAPSRKTRVVDKTLKPVQPSTWTMRADRREQLRRRRGHTYTMLVPRTLAQTGMPATSGRIRTMRHGQQGNGGSPVSLRSRRHGRGRGFFARVLALLVVLGIGAVRVNFALASPAFGGQ